MPSRSAIHWAALRSAAFFNSMFSKYLCCRVVLLPETLMGLYFFLMIAKIKIVISLFLLFYYYQRTRTLAKVDIVIRLVCYHHSAPLLILPVGFIFPFRGLGNADGFHLIHLLVKSGLGIPQHPFLVIVFLVQEFQIVFQPFNRETC